MALALAPGFGPGVALVLSWELAYTLIIVNGISIRQLATPDHLQGRVNTTARMIAWGGTPFGAAVGGIMTEATTVRAAYLIMASGVAASAMIGWFSPLRRSPAPETPNSR